MTPQVSGIESFAPLPIVGVSALVLGEVKQYVV